MYFFSHVMGDTKRNNFDNGLLYGLAITALIDKLKDTEIKKILSSAQRAKKWGWGN